MAVNEPRPGLPAPEADWCLFLDFDGTLVDLREHPQQVTVPVRLANLLQALLETFGGAVAIVSGRSLEDLDGLLAPLAMPLAGIHGLERRDAAGRLHRDEGAERALDAVRAAVGEFVARHDGLFWEDKGAAFAVHFRRAPALESELRGFLEAQRERLDEDFHVQAGKSVFELKPHGRDKGRAVDAFMQEPPFAGRVPVFIGDDVTDEDAFHTVNAAGGHSILVAPAGSASAAAWRVDSVEDAIGWLEELVEILDQDQGTGDQDL